MSLRFDQEEKEQQQRFLDDSNSPSVPERWPSPAPPYDDAISTPDSKPPTSRKRKIIRFGAISFVVLLFLGALATDPKPVYNKATELLAADDQADLDLPSSAEMATEFSTDIVVEGGAWAHQLHNAVEPMCDHNSTRELYPKPVGRTALATFPRSGNTFIRTMVERATGYMTSSDYCDKTLAETFEAECNHENNFFVKTHYPALKGRTNDETHLSFERAVSVIRNPLDCLYSYWQFREAWKHRKSGINVHTARIDVSLGETDEQMADIKLLTARWMEFNELWHQLSVPVHLIRYEDLRTSPLSMLMNLVNFLLPDEEEQPSMEKLSCALELDEEHEAYHSKKRSVFSSWDDWHPETRKWVVQKTQNVWCRNGYDKMLQEELGQWAVDELEVDCSAVKFQGAADFDTSSFYEDA